MSTRTERIIGLELGGSKSARTAYVAADWRQTERRLSIMNLQTQIEGDRERSGDQALIAAFSTQPSIRLITVNAPLTNPPCLNCDLECPGWEKCQVPAVEWMRSSALDSKLKGKKSPTPYTQRPVDLAKRNWLKSANANGLTQEESFGSSRAPLALRLKYLRKHILAQEWQETEPKLILFSLQKMYGISAREFRLHRELDEGVTHRLHILEKFRSPPSGELHLPRVDLFQRDLVRISANIDLFDAFLSCFSAVFHLTGQKLAPPPNFRADWGWLVVPGVGQK